MEPTPAPALPQALGPDVRYPERIELGDIVLRRYTAEDAQALDDAIADSYHELARWMPWCHAARDLDARVEFLDVSAKEWITGVSQNYTICEAGADGPGARLLGAIGVHDRIGPGGLEIGYWLRTGETGRGLMTRAAGRLTEIGLALPGISRMEIHCDAANGPSAAVPRRLGYRLDRRMPRPAQAPGETGTFLVWVRERP